MLACSLFCKTIDFAGSTIAVRRSSIACVADSRMYALLDVDRQLKIPLFPISSLDDTAMPTGTGQVQDISMSTTAGLARSSSTARAKPVPEDRGHGRSTSLGTFMASASRHNDRGTSTDRARADTPDLFRAESPAPNSPTKSKARDTSPLPPASKIEKPLPAAPTQATESASTPMEPRFVPLTAHIVSPSAQEFLLVTGTGPDEPGVGMFVNLEGDVTRSTLEFDSYPNHIVVDGRGLGIEISPTSIDDHEEGFVLASMARRNGQEVNHGLEIQRWDLDPSEGHVHKSWLVPPSPGHIGLHTVAAHGLTQFVDTVEDLQLKRYRPYTSRAANITMLTSVDSRTDVSLQQFTAERELFEVSDASVDGWEQQKAAEERDFALRLGHSKTRLVAWSDTEIWWIVRNPPARRSNAQLSYLSAISKCPENIDQQLDRRKVIEILNSLRGREAQSETEFLSFGFIKQRAGLLLFKSFLCRQIPEPTEDEFKLTEEALLDGALDPRVVLSLVPLLREEVVEGSGGIWIHGGIKATAESTAAAMTTNEAVSEASPALPQHILGFLRHYLSAWRHRKGFGSVSNEDETFRSVDASLLIVLLEMDKDSPKGPAKSSTVRSELNKLVDQGLDGFDRATVLLEKYRRLYVLSRLYQSRKMASEVLATWRRILEGEEDAGGEFFDGELRLRDYLLRTRNAALVEQYGVWLAARTPSLGVQIFADQRSHVNFSPAQVVDILRQGAPGAVKDYLEYLVFHEHHTEHVNELIVYYLNTVLEKLQSSTDATAILKQTYETYRALQPPKPTYRQFITDNQIDEEWWRSRLRLLQLLGGSQGPASDYDVAAILARISPYTHELVPEIIILHGRQAHHKEALQLLTQGLGDYDTAINYCLLGGSSIYHPISGTISRDTLPTFTEQSKLFQILLAEFLRINDVSDRLEQTSSLLERFGRWFELEQVLNLLPDTWSVELVSGFLINAAQRMVRERNEAMIVKGLCAAENLQVGADLVQVRSKGIAATDS